MNLSEWLKLYKEDPDKANSCVDDVIGHEIELMARGDEDKLLKLKQMQWRISGHLRGHTPLANCYTISKMLQDNLLELKSAWGFCEKG